MKSSSERDREYWRKYREDMVRAELSRQGKLPNFVFVEPVELKGARGGVWARVLVFLKSLKKRF